MPKKVSPLKRLPAPPPAPPSTDGAGKVVVAYISPTQVSAAFHESFVNLLMYDLNNSQRILNGGGRIHAYSGANISNGRNDLVRKFLEQSTAEWLLMLDADMTFPPDVVDQLLVNASADRAPIVGGLCFGHEGDHLFPTLYGLRLADEEDPSKGVHMLRAGDYPSNSMFAVDATGAACLLIHRKVLIAMRERQFNKSFPWFQEVELNDKPCGEDITFCLRAGKLGFPIYVDTSVEIGHEKTWHLTAEKFRAQQARDGVPRIDDLPGDTGGSEDAPADHAG